jgi:BirA family biotin operon repressor/biotin-[acetyl-CoA-carboxylase] ligase
MGAFDVADFHHRRKGTFGVELFYFDEVDSTNRIAEGLAKQGYREATVVLANSQSKGRGRNSNIWFSPKGLNLYSTLILRPTKNHLQRLPFVAALAISRALGEYKLNADLKWPNDVLVNDRKIAGILLQSAMEGEALQYAIVGIGINVNVTDFPVELRDIATSVSIETRSTINREQFLANVLFEFEELYARMNVTSWDDFVEILHKHSSYLQSCHVEIKTSEGMKEGITAGLDPFGGLILKAAEGEIVIYSGEVQTCRKKQPAF